MVSIAFRGCGRMAIPPPIAVTGEKYAGSGMVVTGTHHAFVMRLHAAAWHTFIFGEVADNLPGEGEATRAPHVQESSRSATRRGTLACLAPRDFLPPYGDQLCRCLKSLR